MNRFVLTPAAEGDLLSILDHLIGENSPAAVRVLDALDDACRLLADSPHLGHARPDLTTDDVRFWPVFSYLIIYRPDTVPLEIARVLHGKRDVRRLLDR